MATELQSHGESEALWRAILIEGHERLRRVQRLFRYLPSAPRCKLCQNPFGGVGGKLVGLVGFKPSRKNPNLCVRCCESLPPGGIELDIAVLFADVRGSTALGERLEPEAYAALLNRFYRTATDVLVRCDAIIDKLIGDEVMALFIPGICGPAYHRRAIDGARALLRAVGYGESEDPWLHIGGAVHAGVAFVGNVGGEGVVDFTALGDVVNTAAHLQERAAEGEMLLGESVYATLAAERPDLECRTLMLHGKEAPFLARVLRA